MNYIGNNYVLHTWMKWFNTSNTGNCRFCMYSIAYNAFYVIDNKFPSCENCYIKKIICRWQILLSIIIYLIRWISIKQIYFD